MPKSYNIRWRESDHEKLQRAINNFNARLYTQQKSNKGADWLPERVKKTEAVKNIQTRTDFNRFIKTLERFNAKTAEKVKSKRGAETTKWQLNEFKRNQRAENRRREKLAKEIGEKEVTIAGKPTGVKRAEMGKISENAVKPDKKNFENMSQKEWEKASAMMEKRMYDSYTPEKRKLWMRNYVKGLIREGYPDDIIELIKRVDPNTFAKVVDIDETATIAFIYDPQLLAERAEILRNLWSEHAGDEVINNIDVDSLAIEVQYENDMGYYGKFKK